MKLPTLFLAASSLALGLALSSSSALTQRDAANDASYDPETKDCDGCKARYMHCINLAGVPGLKGNEEICRTRVKGGYGTVGDSVKKTCAPCDRDQYYPHLDIVIPPDVPSKRAEILEDLPLQAADQGAAGQGKVGGFGGMGRIVKW